jgi:polar amino acid transport system substrate-binding protein
MCSRSRRQRRSATIAAVLLGAVLTHRVDAAAPLRVCVDQANPTSAIDARVASAAAATQGYAIEQVAFVGHGKEADDGFPVSRFAKMAQSDCELILGFPVDVGDPHLPPGVQSTPAYASTGFVLVERGRAEPVPLDRLPQGSEVGIAQLDTWAGLLFSTHPNIVMHVYREDAEMLADLERRQIAAGLTWQPFLHGWELGQPGGRAPLTSRVLDGRHMLWNLVALYAPGSQHSADVFARGLDALRANGELARLIKPYEPAAAATRKSSLATPRVATPSNRACDGKKKGKAARKRKPPALYTDAQATQGAIFYFQNCGMCHGPLLDGQRGGYPGPALKGADFADPSYDFHVDEIFRFVAKLMPAQQPGSLSDEQNVKIMAFILKQNGYPAGARELTYDGALKSRVPIRYYGD